MRMTEAAFSAMTGAKVVKPRKFRNTPTIDAEGNRFDSKKEAKRYAELGLMLRMGEIVWLAKQVRFALPGRTEYRADFCYRKKDGRFVVEDVKSPVTRKEPVYRMKARQMLEIYGITIVEV